MAFWGGFMPQNGHAEPDNSASRGWQPCHGHDWAVFWPIRIHTDDSYDEESDQFSSILQHY